MKPALVKDRETGELCLQLNIRGHSATLPLPPGFNEWDDARKESFIATFVETASVNLTNNFLNAQRKIRRKTI